MRVCLIITSCIFPSSSFVELNNPQDREDLHISALKRWIVESVFTDIIICDNSDYVYSNKIVDFAHDRGKRLEVLFFKGDAIKAFENGKGFGEGELMKYVIQNSNLILENDSFFKVTGKLFIENYYLFLNNIDSDCMFSLPFKFPFFKREYNFVYTHFYYSKISSFRKYLMDSYLEVRDNNGVYLEHIYCKYLMRAKKINKNFKFQLMSFVPIVDGLSGSTGLKYQSSFSLVGLFKIKIKEFCLKYELVRKF